MTPVMKPKQTRQEGVQNTFLFKHRHGERGERRKTGFVPEAESSTFCHLLLKTKSESENFTTVHEAVFVIGRISHPGDVSDVSQCSCYLSVRAVYSSECRRASLQVKGREKNH